MVLGRGFGVPDVPDAITAIANARERGENDEFVRPTVITGIDGRVRDGDLVIHFNFRADRARQLTHALADDRFDAFPRGERAPRPVVVTLTEYEAGLPVEVAFPPLVVTSLAEVFSALGWQQFHVAETEKYAHVTYFLNGGVEEPWPGEERLLIPSPKVATYDLDPHMSAAAITDAIVSAILSDRFDFLVANFANPDMVGHTGVWDATIEAVTFLDGCLGRIADAVLECDEAAVAAGRPGAVLAVTADHGNADRMRDDAGGIVTAHSLNPVPFLMAGSPVERVALDDGVLSDVAPTLLALAGLSAAPGMTGHDLARAILRRPST
jgi:2,3-bisphosphoglycerate-independent phosphoglycerate mutase